jgi:hypothetical protein
MIEIHDKLTPLEMSLERWRGKWGRIFEAILNVLLRESFVLAGASYADWKRRYDHRKPAVSSE